MSSIDEQFVEFVVKSLVNKPDSVHVVRRIDEKGVLLELTVDPEDLGRVIGKRGATAQSIRTLLRALGTKNDARYNLKIVDNGERPPRPAYNDDQPAKTEAQETTNEPSLESGTESIEEPMDSEVEEPEVVEEEVSNTSDRLSKTRQELEDLDDLDV